jgi:hypothetical protein
VPLVGACGEQHGGAGTATTSSAADDALLTESVADLAGALALTRATRREHPTLRATLAGLQRVHAEQLGALSGGSRQETAGSRPVPGQPAAALALLRREEDALRVRLLDRGVEATSGSLARLLAATSAGVAQQLAVLDATGPA